MTNEWLEFQSYIKKPTYSAASKHDLSYLGRFTFKTITDFEGFGRILTVIARGYLFHNQDGSLRDGNPYERVEYTRKTLCAWCSIPDKNEDEPFTNFGTLAADFPELVNVKGEGWYFRHIQNIVKFVKKNPDAVSEKAKTTVALIAKGFKTEWKKKEVGKYGRLHLEYLKKHRKGRYTNLLLEGALNQRLYEIDLEAKQMAESIITRLADESGIDEDLKAHDMLGWVAEMNNIKASAEEIVLREVVYV